MIIEFFYPQNNIKELHCSKNYIEKHIDSINENIIIKNITNNYYLFLFCG